MDRRKIFKSIEVLDETKKIITGSEIVEGVQLENKLVRLEGLIDEKTKQLTKLEESFEKEKETFFEVLKEEKRKSLEEKEEEALKYIDKARELYDEILREAEKLKEDIVGSTQKEKEEVLKGIEVEKKKATDEGFLEGKNEGFEKAIEKGDEQLDIMIGKLSRIVAELLKRRDEILNGLKGEVTNIILGLTRKIVKEITQENKDTAYKIVSEYITKIKSDGKITIRVNMQDVNLLKESRDKLLAKVDKVEIIDIVEDNSIDEGGCIIETAYMTVDARIGKQISHIENIISDIDIE